MLIGVGLAVALGAVAAVVAIVAIDDGGSVADDPDSAPAAAPPPATPPPARAHEPQAAAAPTQRPGRHRRRQARAREAAARFAAGREGRVAFAVAGADGKIRGHDEHELFEAASVVKALILAAELERLDREGLPLDAATRATLTRMITVSDNDAATQIFADVGPEGITAIAHRIGMRDLETSTIWGATRISPADMALMFSGLNRVLPERYEQFGKGLLGSITPDQSWGIPAVAEPLGWSVRFKGGWRPDPSGQVVNQVAELDRHGTTIAIAILTDQGPSMPYGIETIEGVASRLLGSGR